MPHFPAPEHRDLPAPPSLSKAIGVGVVVMGLAMGTGELIMWPHLLVKSGLGVLWLALVGITFQYFINQEVARNALATGESFFTASARVIGWSAYFWLISAVLLYVWPGWASILGTILGELIGFGSYLIWAWVSLGLVVILTLSGKIAYLLLERTLKIIVPTFLLLLFVISFYNLDLAIIKEAIAGLLNFGYIPTEIDMSVLLGAVVFAGAGGMLNLCVSLWYRDKQLGMSEHNGRITNPITSKPEVISAVGFSFLPTKENLKNWRGWFRYVLIDQGLVFWFLGLTSLVLLGVNAYAVLTPLGLVPEGLDVAILQAEIFGRQMGPIGANIFLVMAYLMLFSVMWTIIDALARIISDIIHTNSRFGHYQKQFAWLRSISLNHLYYSTIFIVIFISAILLPFQPPFIFLIISSVLGGMTMAVYTPLLLYINNTKLPQEIRPSIVTNTMLGLASLFYIGFFGLVVWGLF